MAKEKSNDAMEELENRMIEVANRLIDDVINRKQSSPMEHVQCIVSIYETINKTRSERSK